MTRVTSANGVNPVTQPPLIHLDDRRRRLASFWSERLAALKRELERPEDSQHETNESQLE
jgi:hypothetical protein